MNNSAAIGYMILAAKMAKVDDKTIKLIEGAMHYQMDRTTEEEAEEVYRKS